ncbi:DUF1194 domain-containing protein [Marinibaculum pumilum]|uniref:DUF1194 domain-containing protein n=1 Tax=Marinibaculum pumilum TaxID=1766165 RepID=A0ABV7KYQ3_9PROT
MTALDWLVFVVDRSSSIDAEELQLQRQAYVDALRDPRVAQMLRHSQVAIVEFDSTAETVVPFAPPLVAAQAYQDWAWEGSRGGTGIGRGLSEALRLLQDKPGRRVIDISGDGRDNRDSALLERMRAAAAAMPVEINGLVLGGRTRYPIDDYYRTQVVNGFVMRIDSIGDFLAALRRKILREVAVALHEPGR